MVLLGFSVLLEKLLDGSKTQTIRLPRVRAFKVGDRLDIYWKPRTKNCCKLGEGRLLSVVRKSVVDLNDREVQSDGFLNYGDFVATWIKLHPNAHNAQVDVITWKWIKGPFKPAGKIENKGRYPV